MPNASRVVNAANRLTEPWHNYLASIEKLTAAIVAQNAGQQIAALAAGLDALEAQVAAAEDAYRTKNWEFVFFEDPIQITHYEMELQHGLGTELVIGTAFQTDMAGGNAMSLSNIAIINPDVCRVSVIGGTDTGPGNQKAWMIALYE